MRCFTGTGGADGIAIAKVLKKEPDVIQVDPRAAEDTGSEIARLNAALSQVLTEMNRLCQQKLQEGAEKEAELYETYVLILEDDAFFDDVRERIVEKRENVLSALNTVLSQTEKVFLGMDDEYMRERFVDIAAACSAIAKVIEGKTDILKNTRLSEPTVVVADNLTPMNTIHLDKKFLAGFVLRDGGITSHAVILAKTLGIPAVVDARDAYEAAESGDGILLAGDTGEIVLRPTEEEQEKFREKYRRQSRLQELFAAEPKGETRTIDNRKIIIAVNTGDRDSLQLVSPDHCDGVGLYRTEFLYMQHDHYPSEEEQLEAYREIANHMRGKEVIIRTLDIGGDKQLDCFDIPEEDNPFLGFRAIRICLARPHLFKTQLRAILRASAYGKIKIMFPMIVKPEELLESLSLLEQCKEELRRESQPFDERIEVGMMIETPAAVFMAEYFTQKVDFFSIGTNDLIQYITATDRANPTISSLYDHANISVLKAIRQVSRAAVNAGISLGVCGEMASVDEMIPFLVGCGVNELSVSASYADKARYIVRRICYADAQDLVEKVTACSEIEQARELLKAFLRGVWQSRG